MNFTLLLIAAAMLAHTTADSYVPVTESTSRAITEEVCTEWCEASPTGGSTQCKGGDWRFEDGRCEPYGDWTSVSKPSTASTGRIMTEELCIEECEADCKPKDYECKDGCQCGCAGYPTEER